MNSSLLAVACFITSFLTGTAILFRAGYLTGFFFLCYSLPFFGLAPVMWGENANFWTGTAFSYDSDSLEVWAISLIWLVSTLGVLIGLAIASIGRNKIRPHSFFSNRYEKNTNTGSSRSLFSQTCLILSFFLVFSRLIYLKEIEPIFPGFDTIICITISFNWAMAAFTKDKLTKRLNYILNLTYIYSNVASGDRDFFGLLFGYLILWMTMHELSVLSFVKILLGSLLLVFAGTYISMVRMDITLSWEDISIFFRFNSWNAAILPVFGLIDEEWHNGPLLWGKSYFDLLFSLPPSPFFILFDIEKPITIDNPAAWFYIEGLGGMHAVGVALRNFGLVGVFTQALLSTLMLVLVENLAKVRRTALSTFLFLVVGLNLMHAIWYGLVYITNSLFFVLIFSGFIMLFGRINIRSSQNV